uniref:DUF547 domain-containing protein n=1 Tax=Flavobacterium sp. TaxID=239 RepID=UPI00404B56E8
MKKIILLLILAISVKMSGQVIDYSDYEKFLNKYVSKGVVDYDKVLKNMNEIKNITSNFSKISPNKNWSQDEVKSYWINVYNANIIKLLVQNYPIKSINYIRDPFQMQFISFDGAQISLDYILNEKLRPLNDPRIHFALYSTAISSPVLKDTPYNPFSINYDLDVVTGIYINDILKNDINIKEAKLSKIFELNFEEFTSKVTFVGFINKYSNSKINDKTKIIFQEYEWNLYRG